MFLADEAVLEMVQGLPRLHLTDSESGACLIYVYLRLSSVIYLPGPCICMHLYVMTVSL